MGNKIVICHWDNGGHWQPLEVATSSLKGHEQHSKDIWPDIEGVTDGMNWPKGEAVYLNDCVLASTPEPTATPTATSSVTASPSATLPETGTGENIAMALVGFAMIVIGAYLKWRSLNAHLR